MVKQYVLTSSEYQLIKTAANVIDFCLMSVDADVPYYEDMRSAAVCIKRILGGEEE